jgi:dihydropteroate synthase
MGETLWKVGNRTVDLSRRGMIMGVLNITPDSFSDGGEFFSTDKAVEHGLRMAKEGAQIIDVGGESTRPGSEAVSAEDELRRVIPVIERLRDKVDILMSIDTSKSKVAEAALDAGASIINDVSGGRNDEAMMPLAAKRNAAFIIMHMQGNPRTMQADPRYVDVVDEVADFFRQQYARALESKIDPMAIAFDPGIGFGKTLAHNLDLIGNFSRLRTNERPLVVGVSRKSFLSKIVGSTEMEDRMAATVALTALLRERGANVLRVHDVKPSVQALRAAEAIIEIAK